MDIETFYYSKQRKWIFFGLGAFISAVGLFNLLLFSISLAVGSTYFFIPPFSAFNFVMMGISIMLLATDFLRTAFYWTLFSIALIFAQIFFFLFILNTPTYLTLNNLIFPDGVGSLATRSITADVIFLLLNSALLCYSIQRHFEIPLWIAGVTAGAAMGIAIFFLSFSIMRIGFIHFLEIHLAPSTAALAVITALGVLFYGGTRFAYYFPKRFVWWLPTFASIAALFLTFTIWSTFESREKELIIKNNEDNVEIIKAQILEHADIYLNALNRMKKRWQNFDFPNVDKNVLKNEGDIFTAFPWLQEFGLINAEKRILNFKVPSKKKKESRENLFSEIEKHAETQDASNEFKVFFSGSLSSNDLEMTSYMNFQNDSIKEKVFYYAVANGKDFFVNSIQKFLKGETAIQVTLEKEILFASNTEDLKYKEDYLLEDTFDFFGNKLLLELWPLSSYMVQAQSSASYFLLGIGLLLTCAIFFALYLALMAWKKKQEADKANREKTVFLGNMSHEMRTPLHGIIGSCSLLELSPMNDYQKKWVGAINKSGKMLLGLIDDLLDLSKIETSSITLEPISLNLKNLIMEVVILAIPQAQAKNVNLQMEYDPKTPEHFLLDGKRIRQIILNLVSNGVKYTNEGYVKIHVNQEIEGHQKFLVINVEDTGIGIAPERLKAIFTKYLTIDIRSEIGTGLGLAIVKRLVELMNGKIEVKSELNKGSKFIVKIPVNEGEKKNG